MQAFELNVIVGKKLIELKGKVNQRDACYTNFLKSYEKPKASALFCLAEKLQYQGNELEECFIFMLLFTTAEIYSLIQNSTNIAYQISIVACLFYAITFCSLVNLKYQILGQIVCLVASVTLLIITINTNFLDFNVILGINISLVIVLISKLLVYLQQQLYLETPNFAFSFESNLVIFLYVFWKVYEVYLLGNYSTLFSSIICLCVVNTIKVYRLYDYSTLNIINILSEINHRNEANQNNQGFTKSINLFMQTKEESNPTNSELIKQEDVQNFQLPDKNQSEENKENSAEVLHIQSSQKHYESKKRGFITFLMMLAFLSQVIFLAMNKSDSNSSSIYSTCFTNICSTLFLLMLCEYEKNVKSYQKNLLSYILIYIVDAIIIICSAVIAYFHTYLSYDYENAIFFAIFPFLVIKQFNLSNMQAHIKLDNGRYSNFYLFFMLPFTIRSIFLYLNYTIALNLIDSFIYCYVILIMGIWSNKNEILGFARQIKSVLSDKKQKLKFFDKLKQLRLNYTNIVQTYLYIHTISLNVMYSFTTFADTSEQIEFFIIYFAPLFLYFTCLINTYNFNKNRPESYSPYILSIVIFLAAFAYAILGYLGTLGGNNQIYSLQVFLNVFLFIALMQGQKIAVIHLQSYYYFIRVLLITVFFIFIYLPFIATFIAGYYLTSFSQTYFYYFTLAGFFYLWLLITAAGISIHLVLGLTEKSKKDLFIAQYMENQLKKIGMKENIEKILMISNMYEMLNENSEDLLRYLKAEKNVQVVIRNEMEFEYDYELVEPDQKIGYNQRFSMRSKPINPLDLINLKNLNDEADQKDNEVENPVLTYFKEKQKNKIEISKPVDLNNGLFELKRMYQKTKKNSLDVKLVEKSLEFKEMKVSKQQKCAEYLSRFYNFLSEPSQCISRQTFFYLLKLLMKKDLTMEQTNTIYNRFSESTLINEYKFKKFLVDYVEFKYEMKNEKLEYILRTFCCYEIVPLFIAKCSQFDYHLRRRKVPMTPESKEIWLNDGVNEQGNEEFQKFKLKQLKKKGKLLNVIVEKSKKILENEQISSQQENENEDRADTRNKATKKSIRMQLKNKTFLKPQNIYAIIVNSLIECYIYYQKESQNFKIKSIKFSVSNLLAIATKISDMIFVFGYSTVYLLIAYFQSDFTETTYTFSSINYTVLMILTGTFTIVYIALIFYHKKDFEMGTLGLDEGHRSLTLCDFKFYTTQLLFLLGSALANYIISIGLNSFLCDQSSGLLYNFSNVSCYTTTQYTYVFISLMILVIYWPLSAITFPFSTAMDRSLEIKYKSEFEIVYLQFKFLINGYNTLLNPFAFQTEQLIISILKVVICCMLAILCIKMQPCSYELMNKIQGKIYILLTILSFAGTLCYFVGMLYSVMITGSVIALYLVYFIYITVKNYNQLKNQNVEDDLIDDNIKNQNIKIKIIKENAKNTVQIDELDESANNEQNNHTNTQLSLKHTVDQPSNEQLIEQSKSSGVKITSGQTTKKTFNFW